MISTSATALRMTRFARGMRLIDAAQIVGLGESHLSRMETGDLPIHADELAALASVYDVPLAVLKGTEPLVLSTRRPLLKDSPL